MTGKKKLFLLLPNLGMGGSERVAIHLFNNLSRQLFDIRLVLLNMDRADLLDTVIDQDNIVNLNISRLRKAPVKIIRMLRQEKPDVVLSTLSHLNIMLATFRPLLPKNTVFIARESTIVSMHNNFEFSAKVFNILYKRFMRKFDHVICQSAYMAEDLVRNYHVNRSQITVINNPVAETQVNTGESRTFYDNTIGSIKLVAIGRLHPVKRFDVLLEVAARLKKYGMNFRLIIAGEGNERAMLEMKISTLGLTDSVLLPGNIRDTTSLLAQADVCLMTSSFEGFPNVLTEAGMQGTPVVAFDVPGGIPEIVVNKETGMLVTDGDVDSFAESVRSVVSQQFQRENIRNITHSKFNMSKIMRAYESVLNNQTSIKI